MCSLTCSSEKEGDVISFLVEFHYKRMCVCVFCIYVCVVCVYACVWLHTPVEDRGQHWLTSSVTLHFIF